MKRRSRAACLYAAVAAVSFGVPHAVDARDLIWDWSPGDGVPHDGTGFWDLASNNWVDQAVPGVNTVWVNGDNAIFGGGTSGVGAEPTPFPYNVDLAAAIVVNNLTLADVPLDRSYSISNFSGGSLTLNGNLTKAGDNGQINFFCDTTLSAGNHVLAMRDTGGDIVEFIFNGVLSGTGGLTVNNTFTTGPSEAWGTVAFNRANSYTGVTNIDKGRILLTNQAGLGGSAAGQGTNISNQGTLAFYGAGTTFAGNLTVSEPITITRSQYAEAGGEFARYNGAIQSNAGQNIINGPVVLNTVDARVQVNGGATGLTDGLTISSSITETSPSKLSKSGGGVLFLTGNNTYTGGTAMGGGTVAITTDANIGGPTSPLFFDGGYLRPPTSWSNFGAHPIDNTAWSGGIDVSGATQVFTISSNLTGSAGGFFGKRGAGTLTVSGTNVFPDTDRVDGGTYNVNGSVSSLGLRIRTATVNINNGGSYTTTGQWSNVGTEPGDVGVLNMFGNSTYLSNASDFNVSDNPNTTGTMSMFGTSTLTSKGPLLVSKNPGTVGRLNINENATVNADKTGGDSFVIGRGGGTDGMVTKTGGTLNVAGEMWVGTGLNAKGVFTQSAGATTVNNWFVVGRDRSQGSMSITGGTLTKNGGGQMIIGDGNNSVGTTLVSNNSVFNINNGELWVGQAGGSNGTLTIQDSGAVTVNNWLAIGRAGGTGTVNLSGTASLTKNAGGNAIIGAGGGSVGTLNQTGGTFTNTASETWISEGAPTGIWNFSGGTANLARLDVGRNGGGAATLNMSGTASMTATIVRFGEANSVSGTVNLDGGTLQATQVVDGNSSGAATLNLNGGLLKVGANNTTNWMTGGINAVVKAGGAKIDSNGFDAQINSSLNHDAALGATADGGLTKSGAGVLKLNAANTYTGVTNVNAGTLVFGPRTSLYNGDTASWTAANIVVESDAELALGVGGTGSFTSSDVDTIKALGTPTGGFKNGSRLGFDTTGGDFSYGSVIANTNGGANAIGLVKRGANSLTLTADNTYTGGTTVVAGALVAGHPDAINTGQALAVNAGATLRSQAGQLTALDVGTLTVAATGRVDLNDGGLVKRNGGSGATGQTATRAITALLKTGLENGGAFDWQGPGISSTEAFNDNALAGSVLYGLGVLQNNLAVAGSPDGTTTDATPGGEIYTTFKGRTVALNDTLVRYTYMGDADLSGNVDSTDYSLIDAGFGAALSGWINGDFDYSGVIDSTDYALIDNAFGAQTGVLPEQVQAMVAEHAALFGQTYVDALAMVQSGVVPEPGTMGVLALAGAGLLARRRRNRA